MGGKPQLHRHRGRLRLGLIDGLRLLIKLPGLPAVFLLPGAEHLRALVPGKIAVRKALPGKNRLQPGKLLRRGLAALRQRPFINAGDQRGIFRPLHAALDLQGMDAGLLQLGKMLRQRKILQAQRMLHALAGKAVGHPAGLGAQAPVARPSADGCGKIALTGIAHAKGPVDKDLDLNGGVGADVPGKHHPGKAQPVCLQNAADIVDGHLGGGMDGHIRRQRADHPGHAKILHDQGVGPQLI